MVRSDPSIVRLPGIGTQLEIVDVDGRAFRAVRLQDGSLELHPGGEGGAVVLGPAAAAANIAFSVVARGEFALILVALATAAGLDERLTPFVAIYVLVLAVVSPVLASRSTTLSRLIPARLLRPRAAREAARHPPAPSEGEGVDVPSPAG